CATRTLLVARRPGRLPTLPDLADDQGGEPGDALGGPDSEPEQVGPLTALLLLDLDRFKLVNDTLGHTVGDALLVTIADRLTSALELHDVSDCSPTVARLG